MATTILVTGGAGYIGSVVTERLLAEGYQVIALDNLGQGHRQAVDSRADFVRGDLEDQALLDGLLSRHKVHAVMHLAAHSIVSDSMADPGTYFRNNVTAGLNLLNTMVRYGVARMVFSSSAAVYGIPQTMPIDETASLSPVNPYGESKLFFEKVLRWYALAHGLGSVSLRYFNAAGATARCGEHHTPETHLIPNVLRAAQAGAGRVSIFGADYETDDGTCIRDYVHVLDIADAHLKAMSKADRGETRSYNLGSNRGYSVLEVVKTAEWVTGKSIPVVYECQRPGDPPMLVATSELAASELGWRPQSSDLETILKSAWQWQCQSPDGYSD
jgi:UDP-glucose 4-epimerase